MSGLLSFRAWEKVWMFRKTFLLGLGNTVKVAFLGLLLSLILGIVFGLMATGEKKNTERNSESICGSDTKYTAFAAVMLFVLCICLFFP